MARRAKGGSAGSRRAYAKPIAAASSSKPTASNSFDLSKLKDTAGVKVPKLLIDQVIGQERAVHVVRKAARQKRNVLLIGSPGTGKSLLAQAMAELLPAQELEDVLVGANPADENAPKIKVVKAGEGRKIVEAERVRAAIPASNSNLLAIAFVFISSFFLLTYGRQQLGDVIVAAMLIGLFVMAAMLMFAAQMGKRGLFASFFEASKLLIDNHGRKTPPFIDACLLPGQKVFAVPRPMKIEEMEGQFVYNQAGLPQKVVSVETKLFDGIIYRIKPRLLPEFTATQNHPFLVLERPRAKEFKVREFSRKAGLNKLPLLIKWKPAKELKAGDFLMYPEISSEANECQTITVNDYKRGTAQLLKLDEEIAELLGWYLAEGYYRRGERRHTIGFTLSYKETNEAEWIASVMKRRFGIEAHYDRHNSQEIELLFYSRGMHEFFSTQFPGDAKTKRIPEIIFRSPKTVKIAFLKGYFAGDGYETKDTISAATASKDLADDLVFLFAGLGIFPTCYERKMQDSKIRGRVVKGSYLYEFNVHGKQLEKLGKKGSSFQHYFTHNRVYFVPIRKIKAEVYSGPIVNMETEDGTYLTPCITHNTGGRAGALLGDVRHDPLQTGGLGTPAHLRCEAGAIHKANRGVLLIDEIATLHARSQQELLTAMQEKKYSISGQSEMSSGALVHTEPVPTDFVLVASGNFQDIQRMHPAMRSRIRGYGYEVYMEDSIADTPENRSRLVQFIAQEVKKDGKIPHLDRPAVDEILNEARKRAGRKNRLTLRLRELGGLIRAAGDIAREKGHELVTLADVFEAKKIAVTVEHQAAQQLIDLRRDYKVFLTSGYQVGKVNGLAVIGDSGVILPLVAEVAPAASKQEGKIIATGKLGSIAKEAVENVSAIIKKHTGKDTSNFDVHVQFLQTYEGVEGDSASISVATAVISALEEVPVDQGVALTGSLSVRGEVLPVGGVTQKVDAAIDAGVKKVLVPKSNFGDIALSPERRKAVQVIPVTNIYEVLERSLKPGAGKRKLLGKIKREFTG